MTAVAAAPPAVHDETGRPLLARLGLAALTTTTPFTWWSWWTSAASPAASSTRTTGSFSRSG